MKFSLIIFLMSIAMMSVGYAKTNLPTVPYVDVNKYMGKWYSVTSLPQSFTKKCLYQTAEYELIDSESVSVLNTCYQLSKRKLIRGVAKVDNFETNADLTVYFRLFWGLFKVSGDYKVLALDEDYQYVMVGGEDRKSLWIMSRTKTIPTDVLELYKAKAKDLGFNVLKLQDSRF